MKFQNYRCFAQSFDEGRQWFRAAVAAAGGALHAATNPHGLTPEETPLSTEIGWFGPQDAARVFVSISGTHGVEYFSGAAGQLDWIVGGGPAALAPGVAVCLVHAHNPYGAAWHSRGNEDYVDLNRNYLDRTVPLRPNPLYGELFDILFTARMDEHVLDDTMAAFYAFVARHDPAAALTAMGGGQRTHPTGTLYCGDRDAWSTANLRSVVASLLDRAERVALIDWHTGLGDFGTPTVLNQFAAGSEAAAWAARWWHGAEQNAALQATPAFDVVGRVSSGVAAALRARGAAVVETVVELGTFGNEGVLAGLLVDRWLRFECPDRRDPEAVALQTRMIERLNPSLPEWRVSALEAMRRLYGQTLAGLAAW